MEIFINFGVNALFGAFAAFLTLLLHELSHYVVLKVIGVRIISFKPYPHMVGNHLYLGSVSWYLKKRTHEELTRVRKHVHWSHVAPLIKSIIMATLWTSLAVTIDSIFLVFLFWECADFLWWWFGYIFESSNSDGLKFRNRKNYG